MMVLWDHEGRLWQGFAGSYSTYAKDGQVISGSYPKPDKVPYWAWCALSMHDVKTDQVTMMTHAKQVSGRSEEHTSELQSLMRISYAVFCLKKKKYSTVT